MKGGVGSMCMGGSGGRVEGGSHMGVGEWGAWGGVGGRGESHGRGGVGSMCMGGVSGRGEFFFLLNYFS